MIYQAGSSGHQGRVLTDGEAPDRRSCTDGDTEPERTNAPAEPQKTVSSPEHQRRCRKEDSHMDPLIAHRPQQMFPGN